MSDPIVPKNFQIFNNEVSKNVSVVIKIDGLDDIISSTIVGSRIRYNDPGLKYGQAGIVYGGLRPYQTASGGTSRPYISLDKSSLVLSQKMEQEQGRASISQMTISFVDYQGYITKLCSPGVMLPEIMGRNVKVYLGFTDISYPEDYWLIFQGLIQDIQVSNTLYTISLGDPNLKRKQSVFFCSTTLTTAALDATQTTIPVVGNGGFFQKILGPNGMSDSTVKTYILIDDEYMEYDIGGITSGNFTVTRGARGSIADVHDNGATVMACVELSGNPLDQALKLMLSGWNGPYKTGVAIKNIFYTGDSSTPTVINSITLPDGVDAVVDLGLAVGDYVTISGDTVSGNNVTTTVLRFFDTNGRQNQGFEVAATLAPSMMSPALLSLRSQFDTWPVDCGIQMNPWEVDVAQHVSLRNQYLAQEQMRIFIQAQVGAAKGFIESQYYLPISCYSVTRFGKCSVKLTAPPVADQRLAVLNQDNIIDPTTITIQRSLSNRNFYNEVTYQYNPDDQGNYQNTLDTFDTDSLNAIGFTSTLPIVSDGTRPDLTPQTLIESRILRLLNRYRFAAVIIKLRVTMQVGATMEVGDIVILNDNGTLHIPNFTDGTRNLGAPLYEVKEMEYDIKTAKVSLTLIGNVGFFSNDVFATFAPSSQLASGATTTRLPILPSYGALFGPDEYRKWEDYTGLQIQVHDYYYTQVATTTLVSLDSSNPNILIVNPALPFTPSNGYIVDLAPYSTSTDQKDQQIAKLVHCFWDRTAPVLTGISTTQFTLGSSDSALMYVGAVILIRNSDYSVISDELTVSDVTGTTITVSQPIGFTPSSANFVDLVPWYDQRPAYRFV